MWQYALFNGFLSEEIYVLSVKACCSINPFFRGYASTSSENSMASSDTPSSLSSDISKSLVPFSELGIFFSRGLVILDMYLSNGFSGSLIAVRIGLPP